MSGSGYCLCFFWIDLDDLARAALPVVVVSAGNIVPTLGIACYCLSDVTIAADVSDLASAPSGVSSRVCPVCVMAASGANMLASARCWSGACWSLPFRSTSRACGTPAKGSPFTGLDRGHHLGHVRVLLVGSPAKIDLEL
jgi:hypothetical protein